MKKLIRVVLSSLVGILASSAARADVVPDGQRYVPAVHDLTGSATLAGRRLMLVTLNDRVRAMVSVVPTVGDGPLEVPGGYRSESYLVALTPEQVADLDKVRAGSWSYEPATEREEAGAFRKFFDRKDLVASDALPFKYLVSRASSAQSARIHWTLTGIAGEPSRERREVLDRESIQLKPAVELVDGAGAVLGGGGGTTIAVAAMAGGVVVVAIVLIFFARWRARHLPRAGRSA